jgi:ABC-2 type transport system permease protein
MITDIRTVAWKELHEILALRGGGSGRRLTLRMFAYPIIIGALFGLQTLQGNDGLAVFPVGLMAMTTTISLVTDAVAGERERHTLETLLASPVSDTAIIGGKLAAVVGYSWVFALVQLAAVTAVSIAVGHPLSAGLVFVIAVLSLFEAILAAGFGVQFSLRAPTVRAAARKLGQLSFLLVLPVSGLNVLAAQNPGGIVWALVVIAATLVLVAADVALLALAKARFRRGQLLLD